MEEGFFAKNNNKNIKSGDDDLNFKKIIFLTINRYIGTKFNTKFNSPQVNKEEGYPHKETNTAHNYIGYTKGSLPQVNKEKDYPHKETNTAHNYIGYTKEWISSPKQTSR